MFEIKVDEKGVVTVSGALTIACIGALYTELSQIFNDGICVSLDCTAVTEIDTAAMQVMMAFKKSLSDINRSVDCIVSKSMHETLLLTGIIKQFKVA